MKPRERGTRQVLGTCLSALIVLLSVLVPVLERGDLAQTTTAESRHDPATCSPGHDHILCTQVGANHALPSRQQLRLRLTPFLGGPVAGDAGSVFTPVLEDGHPTRAPPSA
ncbi:MAG TPA: hypothetical protein VLA36_02045 [Longimicrobiales bacterium]|nr:hypothetical protein [Longimicrobiales bacterium]